MKYLKAEQEHGAMWFSEFLLCVCVNLSMKFGIFQFICISGTLKAVTYISSSKALAEMHVLAGNMTLLRGEPKMILLVIFYIIYSLLLFESSMIRL